MRVCRFQQGRPAAAFYDEMHVVPLDAASKAYTAATGDRLDLPDTDDLMNLLPPDGVACAAARKLSDWAEGAGDALPSAAKLPTADVQLLVPIPCPNKLFMLAGNYAAHMEEGGEAAAERTETFPYVFMKPPSTTLTNPGTPVSIPSVSPDRIDYEMELAIVIGHRAKGVTEADALGHVAGYTVINDVSDREFHPHPERKSRKKDEFFDWLHGKWHDSFCPCGPCIVSSDNIADPQRLDMQLRVNGELRQDASTALQIFPVAAVVEFISSFVTLEPGDIISTGTPSGVGNAMNKYLKPGDRIDASISSIGTLTTKMVAEQR